VGKMKTLNKDQIRVLTLADQCKDGGWFYSPPQFGPAVSGLVHRQLLVSKRDTTSGLQVRITEAGRAMLERYGVSVVARKSDNASEFADYCVRPGFNDESVGIFLRDYNVRVATFSANTFALQTKLAALFDKHHAAREKR